MRYAAFLRGINLGGRRATGAQLCALFEACGFGHVRSFLASGNVSFDTDDAGDLESRIETALHATLGYPVETFVRTASEVSEIISREPFPRQRLTASEGTLQVTFLREVPTPTAAETALARSSEQDAVVVAGREWYWLPSDGISRSSLDVRAIERALGRGTTRTINTVARLHAKLLAEPGS